VEGNYFSVKAYQYTNITSVMLLDCFTIPCVMLLSKLFLHAKVRRFRSQRCSRCPVQLSVRILQFKLRHAVGIVLCLAGLCALVASDVDDAGGGGHSRSEVILGDALCLIASLFYSVSNVGQEAVVKRFDIVSCGSGVHSLPLTLSLG
jgi:solute carrier family 35, member F1/2